HSFAHASFTVVGGQSRSIILRDQVIQIVVGSQNHVSSAPAISSARTALRDERFAMKGNAAFAPVSRASINVNFIDEHHQNISDISSKDLAVPRGIGLSEQIANKKGEATDLAIKSVCQQSEDGRDGLRFARGWWFGNDIHTPAALIKSNRAVDQGKQCPVTAS